MARPKKVTAEAIREILKKMRQMKIHQNKKVQIGERSDGQPVYHYPSITKSMIARKLGVVADYLTSIKDPEILDALKHVGQRRSTQEEIDDDEPNPNTKKYLQLKTKRQSEKIIKLENIIEKSKQKILEYKMKVKGSTDLTNDMITATKTIKELKAEIRLLKTQAVERELENASLKLKLELKSK